MRQSLLSRLAKKTMRQGQIGQTIVIMAFGFIVLLAFVGIVTDVSLMFVRYSTLRRAVDAAAVAAAGQIRRTVATSAELAAAGNNETVANGYAFARNLTNINLAARQFIEFYGLSPTNVWVKTCATDPDDAALECGNDQQPRKLVRVTAQLASPTVFLRLIGWQTVTLEASSISETAVLDVVMIFDGAESMSNQTTYDDWKTVPVVDNTGSQTFSGGVLVTKDQSLRYLPPRLNFPPNATGNKALWETWAPATMDFVKAWRVILNMTQKQLDDDAGIPKLAFSWNGTTATEVNYSSLDDPVNPDPRAVRKECRVRFFPFAESVGPTAMYTDLRNSYTAILRAKGVLGATENYPGIYDGFVPAYNYFGCCNDPNGDLKFDDLICQPFKKVRDATEQFLDHIDFVRGDRVGFVTFDRNAYLIDPDGNNGPQLPMITSQDNAVAALRRIVGVRAELSYYADTTNDGVWDAYVKGGAAYNPADPANSGIPISYDQTYNFTTKVWQTSATNPTDAGFNNTTLGTLNDYPVANSCVFANAVLPFPNSLYSAQVNAADAITYGTTNPRLAYRNPVYDAPVGVYPKRWPTSLAAMTGTTLMNPNLNDPNWDASMASRYANKYDRQVAKAVFSYEFRAACAGNNVGAALRVGNNALLDPRTVRLGNSGAVWVMVLLGDGAAASSDPVQRNASPIVRGNPYGDPNSLPPGGGQYGGYGLCPYGTWDNPSGLVNGWNENPPRCSDEGSPRGLLGPTSRHTCTSSAVGDENNAAIDFGKNDCSATYDVDDYARDWADFIGLTELPSISPFKSLPGVDSTRTLLQLPTIFTIGFGLDFNDPGSPTPPTCAGVAGFYNNINDCLGEELLRYIADVGDNNRVDTDYQQDYLNDGVINGVTADGAGKYGDRGPCEGQIGTYANAEAAYAGGLFSGNNYDPLRYNPLPAKTNCGNYYNAPGGPELTKVFEDIASRMFTRITR